MICSADSRPGDAPKRCPRASPRATGSDRRAASASARLKSVLVEISAIVLRMAVRSVLPLIAPEKFSGFQRNKITPTMIATRAIEIAQSFTFSLRHHPSRTRSGISTRPVPLHASHIFEPVRGFAQSNQPVPSQESHLAKIGFMRHLREIPGPHFDFYLDSTTRGIFAMLFCCLNRHPKTISRGSHRRSCPSRRDCRRELSRRGSAAAGTMRRKLSCGRLSQAPGIRAQRFFPIRPGAGDWCRVQNVVHRVPCRSEHACSFLRAAADPANSGLRFLRFRNRGPRLRSTTPLLGENSPARPQACCVFPVVTGPF